MSDLDIEIKNALNENVNLTKEEYKEKIEKADKATEGHGIAGDAPVDEETRHKRIQSNYYGISLNFLSCILSAMEQQTILMAQQNELLHKLLEKENINVN